jgi:phosphoribosylglycinamide formyltransferase 1
MIKIGILASTKGTDMQAIIDAITAKKLNAKISVLISNKSDSYALERAKNHDIQSFFVDIKKYAYMQDKEKQRESFDKEVSNILEDNEVDLILLIGYSRLLSTWFVKKYRNKIMNVHPSLLPKYAGGIDKSVHEEVLKNNEKTTGATLHFVDEGADTGPIIMQKEVSIEENETIESLKEKVQLAEQEIMVKSIDLFEKGKIKVEDGKAIIR